MHRQRVTEELCKAICVLPKVRQRYRMTRSHVYPHLIAAECRFDQLFEVISVSIGFQVLRLIQLLCVFSRDEWTRARRAVRDSISSPSNATANQIPSMDRKSFGSTASMCAPYHCDAKLDEV